MTKDHAFSHEENRSKVCLLCFRKKKMMVPIKNQLKIDLETIFNHYRESKSSPSALCGTCKVHVSRVKSGKETMNILNSPRVVDMIVSESTENSRCDCEICDVARKTLNSQQQTTSKSAGNPAPSTLKNPCRKCLTPVSKGVSHICNVQSQVDNLSTYLESCPQRVQDQVVSKFIKNRTAVEECPESQETLVIRQSRGKPLHFIRKSCKGSISKKTACKRSVSAEDLSKLQISMNLSSRQTHGIASFLRTATQDRKFIESGSTIKLMEKSHLLDDFFSHGEFEFLKINGKEISEVHRVVVHCIGISDFIAFIKEKRRTGEYLIKKGLDGGGGFFKICLSIQSETSTAEITGSERRKFSDGIAFKQFKDSAVKKIFLLAVAPKIQENYNNVSTLMNALDLEELEGTIATDLKLASIISGIMPQSCTHPCIWCFVNKDDLNTCGELRTVQKNLTYYEKWVAAGSVKNDAKNFMNCVNRPLFKSDPDETFLQLIPPPQLHFMLGVVNTIFFHMYREFESESTAWMKKCNVEREMTHGSPAFKGNSCKKLLENSDLLCVQPNSRLEKYQTSFSDFRDVVNSCFGEVLDPDYKLFIAKFRQSYMNLGISVTPKVHAVFFHVEQFCESKKRGLGFYSEQAVESVHSDFNSLWEKYKVNDSNEKYPEKLLRAVCSYNASHI